MKAAQRIRHYAIYLSIAVLAICILGFSASADQTSVKGWTWTKENPKPSWFTWDKTYWPTKPVRGGYLNVASVNYIGLMNPNHFPVNDWNAITYMYDGLLVNGADYRAGINWLAESYRYTSPQSVVMHLRQGVRFHDGTELTAESLKFQIEWILNPENAAWSRAWILSIKSVDVLDTYTVRFIFNQAWAGFPGMMATVPSYMISMKALKGDVILMQVKKIQREVKAITAEIDELEKKSKKADKNGTDALKDLRQKKTNLESRLVEAEKAAEGIESVDTHAVGTGKYMFEEAKPGNYLKLKRNPNWWFGKSIGRPDMPYPDGAKFIVIPDYSIQLANLRAGKIDSMQLSNSQYQMLKNSTNVVTQIARWPHSIGLRFNTTSGPTKDIRVRKAISHAIDRKALIAGIAFDEALPASALFPKGHWCHNPELKPVTFDPELSKKLLAQAGYSDGLVIKGHMRNLPEQANIAEAVKKMLANVGVEWKVDSLDRVAIDDRERNLEYHLADGGWYFAWDPDFPATGLYHPKGSSNRGRSNNPKAIELIEAGRTEVDLAKRQTIYFELEKLMYDDYQDIWLWYPKAFFGYSKRLAGYNQKMLTDGLEGFWHSHPFWLTDGGK